MDTFLAGQDVTVTVDYSDVSMTVDALAYRVTDTDGNELVPQTTLSGDPSHATEVQITVPGSVNVVPVCNSGLGHKVTVDNSQALPLQNAIAGNGDLVGPLGKDGFKPDDVVGVVLINGVATLYVHTSA